LAPYPENARRPGSIRARTVWLAAIAVAAILLAGGILRITWPGSDDRPDASRGSLGGSPALAGGASVKPTAAASRPASAPANPSLDSCLIGTWWGTSTQLIMIIDGVHRVFASSGGQTLRIWPDGRGAEDYTKGAPPSATIKGARWAWTLRGVQTSHVQTRSGRVYFSEIANRKTPVLTRNRKVRPSEPGVDPSYNLPYICSGTRLTTYGNDKVSTDSYQRISHTP
jgi:hypothetical protein